MLKCIFIQSCMLLLILSVFPYFLSVTVGQTPLFLLFLSLVALLWLVLCSTVWFEPWRGSLTCKTLAAHLFALKLITQSHPKPQHQPVSQWKNKTLKNVSFNAHQWLKYILELQNSLKMSFIANVAFCMFVHACSCKSLLHTTEIITRIFFFVRLRWLCPFLFVFFSFITNMSLCNYAVTEIKLVTITGFVSCMLNCCSFDLQCDVQLFPLS